MTKKQKAVTGETLSTPVAPTTDAERCFLLDRQLSLAIQQRDAALRQLLDRENLTRYVERLQGCSGTLRTAVEELERAVLTVQRLTGLVTPEED